MSDPLSALTRYERDPEVRYGFYLRPSYAMSRAQALLHEVLRRQFGLITAGAFMPHATIKGFFRTDATIAEMKAALDGVMADRPTFTVVNNGPLAYGRRSVVLNIQQDEFGETNHALQALHEDAFAALSPFVHPDCTFTPVEWSGSRFFAHLTLIQGMPREDFFDEIFAYLQDAEPIGPRRFDAEYCHLYAFRSEDWEGDWGATLTWEMLHSWKLAGVGPRREPTVD
ncbi:MAG: 2'-5' RNA ligase family protein [Thermomicrobiales bacterium]